MGEEPAWHALTPEEAAAALGADLARGLSGAEAARRVARDGRNEPVPEPRVVPWREALEALTEPLVLLLAAIAVVYAVVGEPADALTIAVVILLVAAAESGNEVRARRAIAALRRLQAPVATVVRDGRDAVVPAAEVARGDLVRLDAGARVPADLRLVEAVGLRADESTLTGEPGAVVKAAAPTLPPETPLADRRTLAFAGTAAVAGRGLGLVVATGSATALGRVAALAAATREPRTPLQREMRGLAARLTWVAVALSVLVPVAGLLGGQPPAEMLLVGLALAFATIPEELPILVTLVLGVGAFRLARRRAIVRRLAAAETLGRITVLATDKTGTLTENRMRIAAADGRADPSAGRLLALACLATDAPTAGGGDPTDRALLEAAAGRDLDPAALRARVRAAAPFDEALRLTAVVYEEDGGRRVAVKGAPEAVLARAALDRDARRAMEARAAALAGQGLRVLAVASRSLGAAEPDDPIAALHDLEAEGLVGLEDPPRPQAAPVVAALRRAGIRVLMVTGDHAATAHAVAARVGIDPADVYARITPEEKLRIVDALTRRGEVVAVTGDGVNDAPALRAAAIGVAMGGRGTDVAREAADLVLADDDLGTVAVAVEAGRSLLENLRAAVRFYLAAKVALVSAAAAAAAAGGAVPFAPIQIIVLELFMDLGASTAFVSEPPAPGVMARPPRPEGLPFLDRPLVVGLAGGGLALAASILAGFHLAGPDLPAARAGAFGAFLAGHVALAAGLRAAPGAPWPRAFGLWGGAALALLVAAAAWPAAAARLALPAAPAGPLALGASLGLGLAGGAGLLLRGVPVSGRARPRLARGRGGAAGGGRRG